MIQGDITKTGIETTAIIRKRARRIALRFPLPDFYKDFVWANDSSGQFFHADPVISRLHAYVTEHLENDFGHGLRHAEKVTLDAGSLIFIECRRMGYSDHFTDRQVRVVQCAGLLHDIKRKEKEHAIKGAEYAGKLLKDYPFSADETEDICLAIRNHEAFKKRLKISTAGGILVSDALYDADKFRWGPDNFTDTVWDMVSFSKIPLSKFIRLYPKGMKSLEKIKTTFRTHTGKKYGPQFIDIGLAIGEELYEIIKTDFAQFM